MNIQKMTKKAYVFFDQDEKEQRQKADDLKKIIKKFKEAKLRLKEEFKKEKNKKIRSHLKKDYRAVLKLLKTARKKYNALC